MNCSSPRNLALFASVCALLAFGSGCGSDNNLTKPGPMPPEVVAAEKVNLDDFSKPAGASLEDLASKVSAGSQYAPANATFTPGANRVAFGLIDKSGKPTYAPTVIYLATSPSEPAIGPFAAPADPMVPQAPYLSKAASMETSDLKAIYEAEAQIPSVGHWFVLAVSKTDSGLVGSTGQITVVKSTKIPGIGDKAPAITTPTVAGGADLKSLETRIPPVASLHQYNFKDVLGKAPIALMFSTPALCVSRVCGPVTDLLLQLQAAYGKKIDAIHQEVYVNNKQPNLNPQMTAFSLETEPWFFTVGKDGLIKARLEGAFGINSMNAAIQAALK